MTNETYVVIDTKTHGLIAENLTAVEAMYCILQGDGAEIEIRRIDSPDTWEHRDDENFYWYIYRRNQSINLPWYDTGYVIRWDVETLEDAERMLAPEVIEDSGSNYKYSGRIACTTGFYTKLSKEKERIHKERIRLKNVIP